MPGQFQTYYITEDALELLTLLPPDSWNYSHSTPHQVYVVLGIKPRVTCTQSKCSTKTLQP